MKPNVTSAESTKNITQVSESTIAQSSRNLTELLPAVFQTETNRQFIESTLDQLLSSGSTEIIDRYWGRINGSSYSYMKDVFNEEHTAIRQNYQLAPGIEYTINEKRKPVSYVNVLNSLETDGYAVSNLDRMFSEPGYVLDLPINIDMFVNYVNYYWLPMELPVCDIEPTAENPINIDDIVLQNTYQTPVLANEKTLNLFNGMMIRFIGDNVTSTSGDYEVNAVYLVSAAGTGNIKLILMQKPFMKTSYSRILPYSPLLPFPWDHEDWDINYYDRSYVSNIQKEYVVAAPESNDLNAWSRCNVWRSIYAIEETASYLGISVNALRIPELMAKRPIIEFKPNIRLYDAGLRHLHFVDHMITTEVDIFSDIIGKLNYVVNGYPLMDSDVILVTNAGTRTNRIYRVSGVGESIALDEIGNPTSYAFKDKIVVINSDDKSRIGFELYWDNEQWYAGQQKSSRASAPLFELFCEYGTSLADFPESTFRGNKLFGYKNDEFSTIDSELGFAAVTNSAAPDEFMYEVFGATETYQYVPEEFEFFNIPGIYHYQNLKTNRLISLWNMLPALQRVKKLRTVLAEFDGQTIEFNLPDEYGFPREYYVISDSAKLEVTGKETYGFVRTRTPNPVIAISKKKQYVFNMLRRANSDALTFRTPLGDISPHITVTESNRIYTVTVAEDYEYDMIVMKSPIIADEVKIFVYNHQSDGIILRKNGVSLDELTDYTITNGKLTVLQTASIGDVYDLEIVAHTDDQSFASDVAPVYKNNPGNQPLFALGYSNLFNHFKEINENNPLFAGSITGRNNYHVSHPDYIVGGSIRQQIYSSSFISALNDEITTNIQKAIVSTAEDYAYFKRFFKSKIQQLWETRTYDSVRELVDDALSEINIGKTNEFKYAYSDMAYYSSFDETEYTVGVQNEFKLANALHSNGYANIHLNAWIYDESSGVPAWKPLLKNADYTTNFDILTLNYTPVLVNLSSAKLLVRLHTQEEYSYIPFSLAKLGVVSAVDVAVNSGKIICHDGSVHIMRTSEIHDINSVDFDPVSASIYDLELRIHNNLVEKPSDFFGSNINSLLKYIHHQSISWDDINAYLEYDFNLWKQTYSYSAGYTSVVYNPEDPFTWNFAELMGTDAASWKTLYRKLFGTYRPHTHPWEMLGHTNKPDWWDTHYSWEAGSKRQSLIRSLKNGITGQPDLSTSSPDPLYSYKDYDWDTFTLVKTTGELNNPVDASIITQFDYDNRSKPFVFGDLMDAEELGWYNSSEYMYSVLAALIKLKPVSTINLFWKLLDYAVRDNSMMSCAQVLVSDSQTREYQRGYRLHEYPIERNELTNVSIIAGGSGFSDGEIRIPGSISNDSAIVELKTTAGVITSVRIKYPGSGYSNDFIYSIPASSGTGGKLSLDFAPAFRKTSPGLNALIVENMNSENSSETLSDRIDSLTDSAVIHLGGYTKLSLIDVQLDGSYKKGKIKIPKENIRIFLNKNPGVNKVFYSGVQIEKVLGGYQVTGYDESRKFFEVYNYNTAGSRKEITILDNQIYRYTSFDDVVTVQYGTIYRKRQDLYNFVRGLGEFYNSKGFVNTDWEQGALDAVIWSLDRNSDSVFFVNGVGETLEWNHGDRGILEEIRNNRAAKVFVVDENRDVIDFSDIVVLRKSESAAIKFRNNKRIAGIELAVVEYEHLISIDPVTRFNDFVFDKVLGIYQDRIKILGERTRNWKGLPSANGYIIQEGDIFNNFDTTAREIERDYINVSSKTSNTVTRKTMGFNLGYQEPSYLSSANIDSTTSFKFSVGDKKYKGTQIGFDAFMRNQGLFGSDFDYALDEEWMVRLGYYGDSSAKVPLQFEITRADVKSNPQLIRLNEYPRVDRLDDDIIDISKNDSRYVSGEILPVFNKLPVRKFTNLSITDSRIFKNHNQVAGLPLTSEVTYIVDSVENIPSMFDLSAEYATIGEWRSNISYSQGDKVRVFGKTYELLVTSTGINSVLSPIVLRGSVLYPVVPNGSTLELTLTQGGTVTPVQIQFSKRGITNSFGLIVERGGVASPSVPTGSTFRIDNSTITFSKRGLVNNYQTIVYTGTANDISILGTVGKRLIIEGVTVDFQRVVNSVSNILLGQSMATAIFRETGLTINEATSIALSRIAAINSLRTKYLLAEADPVDDPTGELAWGKWLNGDSSVSPRIEGYHSGDYASAGLNITFLQSEIAAATSASKPYLSDLQNLLSVDIQIINAKLGLTKTIQDPPSADESITASRNLGAQPNMASVRSRITSGSPISANDIIRTVATSTAETWSASEIVARINSVMIAANRTVTASLTASNQLVLTMPASDENPRLSISPASANVEVGFPAVGTNIDAVITQVNETVNLNIADVVAQINAAAISGVSAIARTVPGGAVLELTSNNRTLTIGTGTANTFLGINAGSRNASTNETIVDSSLQIYDIVIQINNDLQLLGLGNVISAENINNTLLIRSTSDKVTIGNGTANASLGFTSGVTIEAIGEGAENQFNEEEWREIPDPLDFSIWVRDNLGNFGNAVNRASGYNVYQVFDFNYEIDEVCAGIESGDDVQISLFKPHYLQINDYVALVNTNSSPFIDGIHRVTDVISLEVEDDDGAPGSVSNTFLIDEYVLERGFGGKMFVLKPVRFPSSADLKNTITNPNLGYYIDGLGWKPGMLAYVDDILNENNEPTGIAGVYRCVQNFATMGVDFELVRTLEQKIDNSRIQNAIMYSGRTNKVISEFEVYDPIKGLIPGAVDKEIDVKSPYDRAIYTNSLDVEAELSESLSWGQDQVGTTWWDLSTAVYLDYEQGDLAYRQANWGKLYPTASIDIYEWTKSTVLPSEYEAAVLSETVVDGKPLTGEPYRVTDAFGENIYYWSEKTTYNRKSNSHETYYYFWVKNKTTLPNADRTMSVLQMTDIMTAPSDYGINWVAACADGSLLISDLGNCLDCEDAIMQINLKVDDAQDSHNEFILLSEKSDNNQIPEWLQNGLRASLSMIDQDKTTLLYRVWNDEQRYSKNSVVKYNNRYFIANAKNTSIAPDSDTVYWKELKSAKPVESNLYWDIKPFGHLWDRDAWDSVSWDKPFPTDITEFGGYIEVDTPRRVPDPWIHRFNRLGPDVEPRQSWISKIDSAQKTAITKINRILSQINLVDDVFAWDRVLNSTVSRDFYQMNMSKLWVFTDWARPGFNVNRTPNHIVRTESQLNSVDINKGRLVLVKSEIDLDGISRKRIYEYQSDGSWLLVYKENATIKFIDELWDGAEGMYSWDNFAWDTVEFDNNLSEYFSEILTTLKNDIFTNSRKSLYKELWFSMIKYLHSEQDNLNWIIKSSYIDLQLNSILNEDRKYEFDYVQNIIDYLNTVKPYKTKIRNVSDRKSAIDLLPVTLEEQTSISDFELSFSRFAFGDWRGDLAVTGEETTGQLSDISEFTTEIFDYVYDAEGFANPAKTSWQEERYYAKTSDTLRILVTRNENGDVENSNTRNSLIVTDYQNRRYLSKITESNTAELSSNIDSSQSTITLNDIPATILARFSDESALVQGYGVVWIDAECIVFKNIDNNRLMNCIRGAYGTSPAEHTAPSNVYFVEMKSGLPAEFQILEDNIMAVTV